MKRFLAFNYDNYYPGGGKNDFIGDFDTQEEIFKNAKLSFLDILNTRTGKWEEWINSMKTGKWINF